METALEEFEHAVMMWESDSGIARCLLSHVVLDLLPYITPHTHAHLKGVCSRDDPLPEFRRVLDYLKEVYGYGTNENIRSNAASS